MDALTNEFFEQEGVKEYFAQLIDKAQIAANDSTHPLYHSAQAALKGDVQNFLRGCEQHYPDLFATITMEINKFEISHANKQADELLALAQTIGIEEFCPLQIDGLVLLCVMSKIDEKSRGNALKLLAQKGGMAPKSDALSVLIVEAVRKNPNITSSQLLESLEFQRGRGTITDITEGNIEWDENGIIKEAPISGLKDRLSRAKNKIIDSR